MEGISGRLYDALQEHCRLATAPVAVKLAKKGEVPPQKLRRPLAQLGKRLAVCQGMTLVRTIGWCMAFAEEDHACPLPRVFMGHIDPGRFLEGGLGEYYQDDPGCMKVMEASYPRLPLDLYSEIWLAPLNRCEFVPDLVVAYGNPAQIVALIQGANFRHGPGLKSSSSGRYGCSFWIAGVVHTGECTYMVPGPGERIFAGTQDHEMSFAVPYAKIETLVEGLAYIRSRGAYRYPVPNLVMLSEPQIPDKYHEIAAGK